MHCQDLPADGPSLLRAQVAGPQVAPLTTAKQTAVLTLFLDLLPPLFLGLGPQWARLATVASDAATGTANMSLLLNSFQPPIGNDTSDTFPEVAQERTQRVFCSSHPSDQGSLKIACAITQRVCALQRA